MDWDANAEFADTHTKAITINQINLFCLLRRITAKF